MQVQSFRRKLRCQEDKAPVAVKLTIQAYWMPEPTSPGYPIPCSKDETTAIHFPYNPEGDYYIKFKLVKVDWSPCKEYDGSDKYKVVMRNVWADMEPRPWTMEQVNERPNSLRKRYITAPNVEYIQGDSLPPSSIFKVNCNGTYKFLLGFKAITPHTSEDQPSIHPIEIQISGTGLRLKK